MASPTSSDRPEIITPSALPQLPVAGAEQAPLRADALRNRERVLCAARRVIETVGADNLTMEAVAAEAGVGKGTVFRRFGDRSSLLLALLDAEERDLQNALLHGPPPLGPGAAPLDRLIAYGDARLEHIERHSEVLAAAATGSAGPQDGEHPAQRASRMHLWHLLTAAGHTPEMAAVLASALLGFLCAAKVQTLIVDDGHSHETLVAAWTALAQGAVSAARSSD
ncbi:MAG: helix-turn-helix transcriptional regulator [Solirubrobacteraceae bacterium]|nr:helix-turn-helix transcriptional regulator [Solirubrobacteraceae bacterium]